MSAIAGFFFRDGRSAAAELAETMIRSMPHRCLDGAAARTDGPVALAHGALHTLAQDPASNLPAWIGPVLVTADARIDNRDEIIDDPNASEAEVVARAYLRWGPSCAEHLDGDFAFAVWDPRSKVLMCGRDHLGAKPFCYYLDDRLFAFASEPKALLTLPEVPADVDEEYLCYHFFPDLMVNDRQITHYRAIRRLEPASRLAITPDTVDRREYWTPDPFREGGFSSDQDYVDGLLDRFKQAIACRIRTDRPLGSTLSGGLDSSSIVSVARELLTVQQLPLATYSALFDHVPSSDERQWIQAVVDGGGVEARSVHPDTESPLIDLDTVLWLHDGPFYGMNYFIHWHLYRQASTDGVRVLLDGEDGDTTVSHGVDRLLELLQSGDWRGFVQESDAVVRNFDNERSYASRASMLRGYALPYLGYLAKSGRVFAFAKGLSALHTDYDVSRAGLIRDYWFKNRRVLRRLYRMFRREDHTSDAIASGPPVTPGVLRPELIKKHHIPQRMEQTFQSLLVPQFPSHPRKHHHTMLTSGALVHGLEVFERMAAYWGIELRHPFCDRRLVEYCLAAPPRLKLKNGMSRYMFREALQGVVPDSVRLRGGKGDLSDVSVFGLDRFERDYLATVPESAERYASDFIDPDRTRIMFKAYIDEDSSVDTMELWQIVTLTRWLDPSCCSKTPHTNSREELTVSGYSRNVEASLANPKKGGEI